MYGTPIVGGRTPILVTSEFHENPMDAIHKIVIFYAYEESNFSLG